MDDAHDVTLRPRAGAHCRSDGALPGRPRIPRSSSSVLKKERIKRRIYPAWAAATSDLFDYIEMFYNPVPRHGSAGDVSPVEYERRYAQSGQ